MEFWNKMSKNLTIFLERGVCYNIMFAVILLVVTDVFITLTFARWQHCFTMITYEIGNSSCRKNNDLVLNKLVGLWVIVVTSESALMWPKSKFPCIKLKLLSGKYWSGNSPFSFERFRPLFLYIFTGHWQTLALAGARLTLRLYSICPKTGFSLHVQTL